MVSIVLAIILGIGFTLLSVQNPGPVMVNIFGAFIQLPLYMVAGAAFLAGIFVALIFHMFEMLAATLRIHDREGALQEVTKKNEALVEQVEALSLENERLKTQADETYMEDTETTSDGKPTPVRGLLGQLHETFS